MPRAVMSSPLARTSIASIRALAREKRWDDLQAIGKHAVERCKVLQGEMNMFTGVMAEERVREQVSELVANEVEQGEASLLGVPIAVKDNFCVEGVETAACSEMLRGFVAPYESAVTERLQKAGAVLVAKTNMDEFGMGSGNVHSSFGKCLNPVDKTRVPGGSSGGSAAAVASGACVAAIGSDTGGSVRLPAAYCGIVGAKPAYGTVSRHGLIAYASSLDTPGVLAQSVTDSMEILDCISGPDARDSVMHHGFQHLPWDSFSASTDLAGVRVGIPAAFGVESLPSSTVDAWRQCAKVLVDAGAEVVPVSEFSQTAKVALAAYYIIAPAEAASNLARYDGVRYGHRAEEHEEEFGNDARRDNPAAALHDLITRSRSEGFGEEVQRRIMAGNFVLSAGAYDAFYQNALIVRQAVRDDFSTAFSSVDVLLTPTAATVAPTIADFEKKSIVEGYTDDLFTVPASLAGIPSMSVPVPDPASGLPLGMQLMCPFNASGGSFAGGFSQQLLSCAFALENKL